MQEVKYLGVTITEEGISDSKLVHRIKKAKNVLGLLRKLVFLSCDERVRAHHRIPSLLREEGTRKGTTGGSKGAREATSSPLSYA